MPDWVFTLMNVVVNGSIVIFVILLIRAAFDKTSK